MVLTVDLVLKILDYEREMYNRFYHDYVLFFLSVNTISTRTIPP